MKLTQKFFNDKIESMKNTGAGVTQVLLILGIIILLGTIGYSSLYSKPLISKNLNTIIQEDVTNTPPPEIKSKDLDAQSVSLDTTDMTQLDIMFDELDAELASF